MILNATEAGEGSPLVLLHGLFGAARNWGTMQRHLAARHRVIALDLRNHGASPHGAAMDYATMAADVAETLAALDALPAAVLGHSMGGKTAMALALARPQAVTRLVVADIAPVAYPPRQGPVVAALQGLELHPGLTRREADAALVEKVPDATVRAFLLQNLQLAHNPPSWRLGLAEIAAAVPQLESFIETDARYEGPTLFLLGERSDYVQPQHRSRIRALFPAAKLVTLKGAGHWLHAEKPAEFLAAVEPFLTAA